MDAPADHNLVVPVSKAEKKTNITFDSNFIFTNKLRASTTGDN